MNLKKIGRVSNQYKAYPDFTKERLDFVEELKHRKDNLNKIDRVSAKFKGLPTDDAYRAKIKLANQQFRGKILVKGRHLNKIGRVSATFKAPHDVTKERENFEYELKNAKLNHINRISPDFKPLLNSNPVNKTKRIIKKKEQPVREYFTRSRAVRK